MGHLLGSYLTLFFSFILDFIQKGLFQVYFRKKTNSYKGNLRTTFLLRFSQTCEL